MARLQQLRVDEPLGDSAAANFFTTVHRALLYSMMNHVARVLDRHPKAAGIWYVRRIFPRLMAEQMERAGLTTRFLESMSNKLEIVRNKTQAHIDREFVDDPLRAWREASLKGPEWRDLLDRTFATLQGCHESRHGSRLPIPEYTGDDIRALVEAAEVAGLIVRVRSE